MCASIWRPVPAGGRRRGGRRERRCAGRRWAMGSPCFDGPRRRSLRRQRIDRKRVVCDGGTRTRRGRSALASGRVRASPKPTRWTGSSRRPSGCGLDQPLVCDRSVNCACRESGPHGASALAARGGGLVRAERGATARPRCAGTGRNWIAHPRRCALAAAARCAAIARHARARRPLELCGNGTGGGFSAGARTGALARAASRSRSARASGAPKTAPVAACTR